MEIARELKFLPLENEIPESSDLPDLTEEETQKAIAIAREAKKISLASKRYWDRVKLLTEIPVLNSEQYLKMILERAKKEIPDFEKRENQMEVYKLLSMYFTGDPSFEAAGYSLKKGIILFGGVGCGKTSIMKMFVHNPLFSFVVLPCRKIASNYVTEGETVTESLDNGRDALAAVVELYEDLGKVLPLKNLQVTEGNSSVWLEALVATA